MLTKWCQIDRCVTHWRGLMCVISPPERQDQVSQVPETTLTIQRCEYIIPSHFHHDHKSDRRIGEGRRGKCAHDTVVGRSEPGMGKTWFARPWSHNRTDRCGFPASLSSFDIIGKLDIRDDERSSTLNKIERSSYLFELGASHYSNSGEWLIPGNRYLSGAEDWVRETRLGKDWKFTCARNMFRGHGGTSTGKNTGLLTLSDDDTIHIGWGNTDDAPCGIGSKEERANTDSNGTSKGENRRW